VRGKGGEGMEGKGRGKESKNTPSINSCLRPCYGGDVQGGLDVDEVNNQQGRFCVFV